MPAPRHHSSRCHCDPVTPEPASAGVTPCDPENQPFSAKNSLLGVDTLSLGVDTLRRHFFKASPGSAPAFRAFSARNLARAAPNIGLERPCESQRKPSAFGARFRRNSATRVSRIRQENISDSAQRTVFGLAAPHPVGLPQFQRLSAARARCLSGHPARRLIGRHLGAPRRAGRPRRTRFCVAF